MLLSDVKEEAGPIDPFKTMYNQQHRKSEVAGKISQITHHQPKNEMEELRAENEGPGIKRSHNYKWTTVEN